MNAFLDKYMEPLQTGAATAAAAAQGYAERIIARLDRIQDTLQSEEFIEVRKRFPATLTADTEIAVAQVPVGETWELEVLGVMDTCTITVNESGSFRYAKQFDVPDTLGPGALGLIFPAGSTLTMVSTGNASPLGVYLQFKARRLKLGPATRAAGQIVELPTMPDHEGRQDATLTGRHG